MFFKVQIKFCSFFQAKDIRGGSLDFKIHYWLGENTTQVRTLKQRRLLKALPCALNQMVTASMIKFHHESRFQFCFAFYFVPLKTFHFQQVVLKRLQIHVSMEMKETCLMVFWLKSVEQHWSVKSEATTRDVINIHGFLILGLNLYTW